MSVSGRTFAKAKVTTISKSGTPVKGAKVEEKIDLSLTDDATFEALTDAMAGADAVVSCIGVIGGDDNHMLAGNGFNNVRGIKAAKAAGVERFVYVSVASIVPEVVGATPLCCDLCGVEVLRVHGSAPAVIPVDVIPIGLFGVSPGLRSARLAVAAFTRHSPTILASARPDE